MRLMRVAVCDDDDAALGIVSDSLRGIFAKHGYEAELRLFSNAEDLEKEMSSRRFDLLLLDIDMPGTDGITFARSLREQGDKTDVIFISSREDLVFDSLRVSPMGFIRKSVFLQDMSETVNAYLNARANRDESSSIVLREAGLVRPLRADAISYIEGRRSDQIIHLVEGGKVSVRGTMRGFEEELAPAGFIRIHQGYLVNYRQIKLLENQEVKLLSGETLPISRRKATSVRAQYVDLVRGDELIF